MRKKKGSKTRHGEGKDVERKGTGSKGMEKLQKYYRKGGNERYVSGNMQEEWKYRKRRNVGRRESKGGRGISERAKNREEIR